MADADPKELPDGTATSEVKPKDATPWLNLIGKSERALRDWNDRCDNIDKLYANLSRLSSTGRDRQMQLFWANMQVLAPSVYARTPVPVVMPRFNNRKPIPRTASELLERSAVVSFETSKIDRTLKLVRDDLVRLGRGVMWGRYETGKGTAYGKKVCPDFKFRRDFAHDPARCWAEVDWVAAASYLTRAEMRKRFRKASGDSYQTAEYQVRKDSADNELDPRLKAKVWELWSKSANKVVWVAEGGEHVLDEDEPHLTLDDFFPCPEPAFGTKQPESLIPVPDVLQYKDQLEDINELTARISALTESIKVAGFYPAGAGEIGDAVEAAVRAVGNNTVLVPVSNWAMLGDGSPKDMVVWWPIDQIATTVRELVMNRRQLIQDVYEVSGISDILRGQSNPNETFGAQELKAQTGSVRVKSKQEEMVRISRDFTCITAEIMAEEFDPKTLLAMAQMELPTDADIAKQVKALEQQGKRMKAAVEAEMAKPEIQQQAQANPEEAQKAMAMVEERAQALQAQIVEVRGSVTIDQVMKLLRNEKLRPFILDIETDSTIVPDENAQKQRATEYVTAMSPLIRESVTAVMSVPQMAPIASEIVRYVNGVFRVGRQFGQVIDEFTEQMKELASKSGSQPKGPSPEQLKAQADAQEATARQQIEQQRAAADAAKAQSDALEKQTAAQRQQVENAERMQALEQKRLEAADASAKRQAELADARELAQLQRTLLQEKHQAEMAKAGKTIELTDKKIEQTQVGTVAAITKAATTGSAPAPQGGA